MRAPMEGRVVVASPAPAGRAAWVRASPPASWRPERALVLVDIGTVAGRQFPEHGVATKTELEEVGRSGRG